MGCGSAGYFGSVTFVAVIVVLVVVFFLLGLLAPRKSRRAQAVRDRFMLKGERKSDENAGVAGDAAESALSTARRAGDKSAETGREAHEKATH